MKTAVNSALKLPDPFPHAPKKPGKYAIECSREGKLVYTVRWATAYAARHCLDALICDDDYRWRSDDSVHTDSGVTIQCDELEELIEYKLKGDEAKWELPEPYVSEAHRARTGKTEYEPKKTDRNEAAGKGDASKTLKRTDRKIATPDGYVSLADICKKVKVDPREARQYLRKNIDKPKTGWSWSKADAVKIERKLKEMK